MRPPVIKLYVPDEAIAIVYVLEHGVLETRCVSETSLGAASERIFASNTAFSFFSLLLSSNNACIYPPLRKFMLG